MYFYIWLPSNNIETNWAVVEGWEENIEMNCHASVYKLVLPIQLIFCVMLAYDILFGAIFCNI